MSTLLNDLRYALRQLRRSPAFTFTAILTLALGLGVTTTVFSVARQVLLAPLPYRQPEQLVGVAWDWPGQGATAEQTGASAEFLVRNSRSFTATALMHDSTAETALSDGHGHVANLAVQSVSAGYFRTLGTGPALGRAFTTEEDRPGGAQAIVLSHALWTRQFGANPGIVGQTVRLDQQAVTVVGVMPANFRAEAYRTQTSLRAPDAWRPLQMGPKDPGYGGHNYQMWARLKPGVTLEQARAELTALDAALFRAYPALLKYQDEHNQLPHCAVYPLASVVANGIRPSLMVMAAAVGAVLLLACLNLAGLNTARALRRGPELALRAALGASRGRLLRLALVEVAVLTAAGGAGAALVSGLLLPFLLSGSPVAIPQVSGAASPGTIAGYAAALSCVSALLFGIPMATAALRQSRPDGFSGTRTAGTSRQQAWAGKALLVAQMSLTVVLLSAASLLLGTFLKLRAQPLGFQPDKLAVFQTSLRGERYATTTGTGRFVEAVLAKLRSEPGVRSAAAVNGLPLDSGLNDSSWPDARSGTVEMTEFRAVTPGYLQTMGIPVLTGRDLLASDTAASSPVAVISAATAAHWWPGRSALGAQIHTGDKTAYRIVGVAADVPGRSPADRTKVLLYAPFAQLANSDTKMLNGWFPISFTVRLAADVDLARMSSRAVAEADPEIPVRKLTTMREVVDRSVAAPRFFTQLAQGFAGFAVLLTAIGLFGLLSYQVAQRTREIGIRMALGASRGSIVLGVVGGSAALACGGAMLGGIAAFTIRPLLTRWIAEYVLNIAPIDHTVLFDGSLAVFIAILLLSATTLLASLLPARQAAGVDPIEALRTE